MGFTQGKLAELLGVKQLTVGRWERGESPIGPTAEVFIRKLAIEKLKLPNEDSIEQLSSKSSPSDVPQAINVAANENRYCLEQQLAA